VTWRADAPFEVSASHVFQHGRVYPCPTGRASAERLTRHWQSTANGRQAAAVSAVPPAWTTPPPCPYRPGGSRPRQCCP